TSKYSRARIRSRVRRPKRAGASRGWMIATIGILVVGALLVVLSYNDRQTAADVAPRLGDHFHAYLGVNICGTWEPAVPAFEGRDGSNDPNATPRAGIHSHADFLIHDHPFGSDESGKKATLGRYLGYAQTQLSSTAITLWSQWAPNVDKKNGQTCPGAKKPAEVQYKVGRLGKPWPKQPATGNPADWHMANGDIIAVYFLPKGAALDQPPGSDQALNKIDDLGGQSAVPTSATSATTGTTAPTDATTTSSSPAGSSTTTTKP
ncbi:MAG: hypothetical protein ABJC79_04450, partial [Acidimicrobiia bacterium]